MKKDIKTETYTFEEALEAVMEGDSWKRYKDEPTDYNIQFVLEDMYNIAVCSGFTEGRHSMGKEWKIFSDRQDASLKILQEISESITKNQYL